MAKIICTGSEGFLGSHLAQRLTKDGHDVIGWDISEGFDICDPKLDPCEKVDAIFHLACPVNPENYEEVAIPTILASSQGTYNMLELAKLYNAKFLYVSSSEVYGESKELPFLETDPGIVNTLGKRAYYGESKRFGEMITMAYHHFFGVDVRIVRPFNIYGPGMRNNDTRVIPSFFRAKKENRPLIVNAKGLSSRSFCYVDDFTEGIIRSMFYPKTNGEVFNLGSREEVTMLKLAAMISDNIEIKETTRGGEQYRRIPDIWKARTVLSWVPTTPLARGLEVMWKSYQS